jgi:hypothetical protein
MRKNMFVSGFFLLKQYHINIGLFDEIRLFESESFITLSLSSGIQKS